jgi:glycosyltransferase involved in cell wall biosynthesis
MRMTIPALSKPKVSVGIPTFNRGVNLLKTVESVLSQDYPSLEVIISDNASTDNTNALCREMSLNDSRIKYIRQSTNRGPTANFREVLARSSGDYFMWLGDDDWIDRSYVRRCLNELLGHEDYSLVCGLSTYHQDGCEPSTGEIMNLKERSPLLRMMKYYATVGRNGAFYGLMRRGQISQIALRNVMGGDWLFIGAVAFLGRIRTLRDVSIHRRLGGASLSYSKTARGLSLTRFEADFPHLAIAALTFKNILYGERVFDELTKVERILCASFISAIILVWRAILPWLVKRVRKVLRVLFFLR